ncbi:hypothetical protein GCM10022243_53610 [Saccharothrix violaceirubra]|uniref:Anti-sigma factor antagonist n=1 Tax=Saccharothrix violaceirubra TaxID=413306 RepID=A0A7W7WTS2_9PSEU|nr:STAS domain-containing protein [Saccharothrix violaceirubra]MBB4963424.1 anti-anti-sigma factor [Saccharothrix violaceirubra]
MTFEAYLGFTGQTATVFASGELGAETAPVLRSLVERAAAGPVARLVLDLTGLSAMSSAGVRVLAFAQQSLPSGVPIIVVGARPEVVEIIRLAGFDQAVSLSPGSS